MLSGAAPLLCLIVIFSWILQLALFPLQDILYLHNSLEEVNSALVAYQRQNDLKFEGMNETLSNLTQRINLIESNVVALGEVENRANLTSSMVSLFRSFVTCFVLYCVLFVPRWHSITFENGLLAYLRGYTFVLCLVHVSVSLYTSSMM